MATGMELMLKALMPKGFDLAQFMEETQASIKSGVSSMENAEARMSAVERKLTNIEFLLSMIADNLGVPNDAKTSSIAFDRKSLTIYHSEQDGKNGE